MGVVNTVYSPCITKPKGARSGKENAFRIVERGGYGSGVIVFDICITRDIVSETANVSLEERNLQFGGQKHIKRIAC